MPTEEITIEEIKRRYNAVNHGNESMDVLRDDVMEMAALCISQEEENYQLRNKVECYEPVVNAISAYVHENKIGNAGSFIHDVLIEAHQSLQQQLNILTADYIHWKGRAHKAERESGRLREASTNAEYYLIEAAKSCEARGENYIASEYRKAAEALVQNTKEQGHG